MLGIKFGELTKGRFHSSYDRSRWALGEWRTVEGMLQPCLNGFHFYADFERNSGGWKVMQTWCAPTAVALVEVDKAAGVFSQDAGEHWCSKHVARRMRILAVWRLEGFSSETCDPARAGAEALKHPPTIALPAYKALTRKASS